MREREPRRRIRQIAAWAEFVAGGVLLAWSGIAAVKPQETKENFGDIPGSMGWYLEKTGDVGIPTSVALIGMTGIASAFIVDGVRKIEQSRR